MYVATLEVECILSHHVDFPETMRSFSVSSMMLCTLQTWSHVNFITSVESICYNIKVQVGEVIGDYLDNPGGNDKVKLKTQVVLTLRSRHCWKDALLTSTDNAQRGYSKGFGLSLSLSIYLCPCCLQQMTLIIFFFFPLGNLWISDVNFLDSPYLLRVWVQLLRPYALLCSTGTPF